MKSSVMVCGLGLMFAAISFARPAAAQRFEGVITMKLNAGSIGAVADGRRGGDGRGAPGRGAAGRGADGRAGEGRATAGRAGETVVAGGRAAGRAGETVVASGRAAGRAGEMRTPEGRGGEPRVNDAQTEAMRAAFAGGLQQIEYMSRRGKIRVAVVGASGAPSPAAMIYVPDEGVMYTLLPPVSMYSETSIADMQANMPTGAAAEAPGAVPVRAPTVTHTKQFELVAGHKCEHVVVTLGKQKTDICMGKGLGVFIMPAGFGRAEGWDRVLAESNGFPLKVTQGNGTVTMEVIKIERKALPEALFGVPDSYSKMPDFMRRPPG